MCVGASAGEGGGQWLLYQLGSATCTLKLASLADLHIDFSKHTYVYLTFASYIYVHLILKIKAQFNLNLCAVLLSLELIRCCYKGLESWADVHMATHDTIIYYCRLLLHSSFFILEKTGPALVRSTDSGVDFEKSARPTPFSWWNDYEGFNISGSRPLQIVLQGGHRWK